MPVLFSVVATLSLQLPSSPRVEQPISRRNAMSQVVTAAAASLALPLAARADVRGPNENVPKDEKGVNKLLTSQGFSPMKVPSGYSPLVQYIGSAPPANIDGSKSKSRAFSSTLLVRFLYPTGWLVESPSIDENGEAGNIGANNYVKGDSANFAAVQLPKDEKLTTLPKEFWKVCSIGLSRRPGILPHLCLLCLHAAPSFVINVGYSLASVALRRDTLLMRGRVPCLCRAGCRRR